ncbi:MAG TPA: S-methyl-5'-thioadenosine phosphorylase [Bacillota bacterium]
MSVRIAIIGGTGVYDPDILEDVREEQVETPYGPVDLHLGRFEGHDIAFLARHGRGHAVPPHRVNYRANVYALSVLGVERVIATNAVGSLRERFAPGHFVLADQFLDFTRGRPQTFFEGGEAGVYHIDVTEPYCPQIRRVLYETGRPLGLSVHDGATYVCTEGPRFETPAEIRMFDRLGGDLVGMTSVPEAVLAREAGLCYATVCMVTNYAAGLVDYPLSHEEVLEVMARNVNNLRTLIMETIPRIPAERSCGCADASPLKLGLRADAQAGGGPR